MYHLNSLFSHYDGLKETLRKYGFKKGSEYTDYEEFICNDYEYEDFWLFSMNPDDSDKVQFTDEDCTMPVWSIHIMDTGKLWIDCIPNCTYHISSPDMEQMLYTLYKLIKNDIIIDTLEDKKLKTS